jgi:hypothetical protein
MENHFHDAHFDESLFHFAMVLHQIVKQAQRIDDGVLQVWIFQDILVSFLTSFSFRQQPQKKEEKDLSYPNTLMSFSK